MILKHVYDVSWNQNEHFLTEVNTRMTALTSFRIFIDIQIINLFLAV